MALVSDAVQTITLEPIEDFCLLGRQWQALEAEADGGFFRSWIFLGCEAETRFAGARLLRVRQGGQDVALALLGRRKNRFCLNHTGDAAADSVFIEHNGLLLRRGHEAVLGAALRHVLRHAPALVLSGVDAATLRAAQEAGWVTGALTRKAPCVAIDSLEKPFLETLSANTRGQIRRSMRAYGDGLALARAATLAEALHCFDDLVVLHEAAWQARGKPGAFAAPGTRAFHTTLIARAWEAGQVDLLRITAQGATIGVLYLFCAGGRAMSYQSGFAFDPADKRAKPGLVCHALAIAHYADRGMHVYDLLAGEDRYKTSLARDSEPMHWAVLHRPWSSAGMLEKGRDLVGAAWLRRRI